MYIPSPLPSFAKFARASASKTPYHMNWILRTINAYCHHVCFYVHINNIFKLIWPPKHAPHILDHMSASFCWSAGRSWLFVLTIKYRCCCRCGSQFDLIIVVFNLFVVHCWCVRSMFILDGILYISNTGQCVKIMWTLEKVH